jgi:hypothetical protein
MKQLAFIFSVAVIFILSGCATPQSVIRLKPESTRTSWFYGQEFSGDSAFGIIAKVAFDQVQPPYYLFDVEITNRSNMDYLVNPSDMFIVSLDGNKNALTGNAQKVVDPEARILELDKRLATNSDNRKASLGLVLLAAGVDIATGIAADNGNPRRPHVRTDLFPLAVVASEGTRFTASDLNQLRDTWKKTALRKTTLQKGYSIRGKILASVIPDAPYIQLNIPVDNELLKIDFTQVKYDH